MVRVPTNATRASCLWICDNVLDEGDRRSGLLLQQSRSGVHKAMSEWTRVRSILRGVLTGEGEAWDPNPRTARRFGTQRRRCQLSPRAVVTAIATKARQSAWREPQNATKRWIVQCARSLQLCADGWMESFTAFFTDGRRGQLSLRGSPGVLLCIILCTSFVFLFLL